jgi:mitochondrial fission protein ELM1
MNITILLEGRAGHEKQSMAIVRELQLLTEVDVQQITLPGRTILGRIAEFFSILFGSGQAYMRLACDTDIFLGTGSRTHLALIGFGKRYRKPIVTCMAPEPFLRSSFDLCCVPRHDGLASAENIFFTDGPPVLGGPERLRDPVKGLILVGGIDERSHKWQDEEIVKSINKIVSDRQDISWSVSSSPRTPLATVTMLQTLATSRDNMTFYHFKETARGWVEEQYAQSTFAWVTADSVSMVYESVTAGCRVGVLPVKWNNPNNKFQRSLDYLSERRLIIISTGEDGKSLDACDGGSFNEARRCAMEILNRFFPGKLK